MSELLRVILFLPLAVVGAMPTLAVGMLRGSAVYMPTASVGMAPWPCWVSC
jgi:hypothetical protein